MKNLQHSFSSLAGNCLKQKRKTKENNTENYYYLQDSFLILFQGGKIVDK